MFRDLAADVPTGTGGSYVYTWTLMNRPNVGDRVMVRGSDGRLAPTVIVEIDPTPPRGIDLVAVARMATPDEITAAQSKAAAARDKKDADEEVWLDMARKAAGLSSTSRRRKVPDGFPEIAPRDGAATSHQAGKYARMWWRAAKRAEERGRPADEAKRFSEIAHRWYAIHNREKGKP